VLAAGWFLTLIALLRKRRPVAPKTQKPQTPDFRSLEKAVQKHCAANDTRKTRDALLSWAQARWPEENPTSLVDLSRLSSTELAEPLHTLNAALYSAEPASWNGSTLQKAFEAFNKQKMKPDNIAENLLEPLYKT